MDGLSHGSTFMIQMMPVCISVTQIIFCYLLSQTQLEANPRGKPVSVALKATKSPCCGNATAGLKEIKKSVFVQRKCGKYI